MMDNQTLLAVGGIVATVLLGIWAIAITVRYNRSVRITYAHEQAIALTDDITQNFPDLSISYYGQSITENLVLLKGYFINTGKKDITREMVEQQITIILPDGHEWMECKVVEHSPSLKATSTKLNKTQVAFDMGLWKSKEYMKFEALAKVPLVKVDADNASGDKPALRLRKALLFTHRIADSTKIDETRVPGTSSHLKSIFPYSILRTIFSTRFIIVMSIVMLTAGIGMWSSGQFYPIKALGFNITEDGKQRSVAVDIKDEKIILTENTGYQKECSYTEFDAMDDKKIQIVQRPQKDLKIVGIIYSIIAILFLIISSLIELRERRLLSIITRDKS